MRRLLRDVAENRELGDVTTLTDSTVMDLIQTKLPYARPARTDRPTPRRHTETDATHDRHHRHTSAARAPHREGRARQAAAPLAVSRRWLSHKERDKIGGRSAGKSGRHTPHVCPHHRPTQEAPPVAAPTSRTFLGRLSLPERTFVADALRTETVGGVLLLVAAVVALIWANTPLSATSTALQRLPSRPRARSACTSPSALGRRRPARGLLLRRRYRAQARARRGRAARPARPPRCPCRRACAAWPCPRSSTSLVNASGGGGLAAAGPCPTATDIAFALAVLAVIGTALPSALRAFLLTLAVVDDLVAILIIAIFFTEHIDFVALGGAVAGARRRSGCCCARASAAGTSTSRSRWSIWALMHASGVHATIAGVAMGLMLRCTARRGRGALPGRAHRAPGPPAVGRARRAALRPVLGRVSPLSGGALADVFTGPETLGVVLGLVVGKAVGVFGGTWLAARFTRAELTRTWPGRTSSPSPPSPASASPSRCSSANSPSPATQRSPTRSRRRS